MISKEKPVIESLTVHSDYTKIVFSKYMKPDSISSLRLLDAKGKNINYEIEHDNNLTDGAGTNYAREYLLRYQDNTVLEAGSSCKLISDGTIKSYADIAMEPDEIDVEVEKNIQIIAPDEVTVKMGESLDIPVYIANNDENLGFTAISNFEDIVSVEKIEKDYVRISAEIWGTADIVVNIPEKGIE